MHCELLYACNTNPLRLVAVLGKALRESLENAAGVVGIDNFNDYYPVALKRARQAAALSNDVYIVDGDLTDSSLLRRIFNTCAFTHVLHLAAQVKVSTMILRTPTHHCLSFLCIHSCPLLPHLINPSKACAMNLVCYSTGNA